MEFEAVKPAHRRLAPPGVDPEDMVLVDASGVANRPCRRVNEADPGAVAILGVQIEGEREEDARQQLHEAIVTHEVRELGPQMDVDILGIKRFEGAVAGLLEEDRDGHDFARMYAGGASPLPACCQQFALPVRFKRPPDTIYRTKQGRHRVQVEYTHADTSTAGLSDLGKPHHISGGGIVLILNSR
jgi:hypothetical protein